MAEATSELETIAERIVDALERANGEHPGCRRVHAKGTVCEGSFTSTPEAAALSDAAHLQACTVPASVRLSNASGNPRASDVGPLAGRGMAVKFEPPGGEASDIVAVALPVFLVGSAADFLAFTEARARDPATGAPDPERVSAFVAEHPETARALQLGLPEVAPTTSYATSRFNALHAFALVKGEARRWGRYEWVPEAGHEPLDEAASAGAGRDYLQEEIRERLAAGPVAFGLDFRLAADGDSLTDPTEPWEGEREVVRLGRLELTGVIEDPEADGVRVWDPMNLCDGVEPSEDEILAVRTLAYSVSIERRAAGA